jgi:hypothetical protein
MASVVPNELWRRAYFGRRHRPGTAETLGAVPTQENSVTQENTSLTSDKLGCHALDTAELSLAKAGYHVRSRKLGADAAVASGVLYLGSSASVCLAPSLLCERS